MEEEPVPDERRCKRTDGRRWRCKRPVVEGKLLCEIHYVQGRFRNGKKRVPDALKLQRSKRATKNPRIDPPPPAWASAEDDGNGGIRVKGREHLDRKKKRKRSWAADMAQVDDIAKESTKIKAEELLRVFAKRDIGRKKKQRTEKKKKVKVEDGAEEDKQKEKEKRRRRKKNVVAAAGEQGGEEVTRDLPYGRMAISPLPESVKEPATQPAGNAAPPSVKLGLNPPNYRLVNRRFRSKNIERPPISTVKAVPYAGKVRGKVGAAGGRDVRRKCHLCQRNRNVSLNKCLTCKKRYFCSDCIKERSIDAQEVKTRCLVCRGTCECDACLTSHPKDTGSEDNLQKQFKVSKHHSFHYMISLVLPILEQINEEQRIELEMEAKLKGQSLSEVEIRRAEIGVKEQVSCNKCSSFILDLHRSCPNCSYNLCLSCCQESRSLMLGVNERPGRKKSVSGGRAHTEKKLANKSMQNVGSLDSDSLASLTSSKACSDNLLCPSLELGGCGISILDLRCVFQLNYTKEMEITAKEILLSHESPKISDASLHCSLCSTMAQEGGNKKELLEASRRKHPGDNFLYCPSIHDDYGTLLVHFQKHWRNCHPVVVRGLPEKASNLSWDPMAMFSSYLKMHLSRSENDKEETSVPNCMDWYKVEFSSKESFTGSLLMTVHSSYETLKLKAKLSSLSCQRVFADHYAEIFDALPIQEYTNPSSGLLNLAAMSAEDSRVSEFSPYIHITCGSAEEVQRGELVDALCYSSHDLVNILVHASDFTWSADQVNKIKTLIRMKNVKDMGGCNGLDLDNGMTREHSEITEEAGQPHRKEGTPLSKGMGAISSFPAAIKDPPPGILRKSTAKAPCSEMECDSSMMCSGTCDSPEKPIGEIFLVNPTKPSTLGRESGDQRPCGVQWDVFRRQDTPKLLEYIRKHSDELYNLYGSSKQQDIDPILDGSFFLDTAHKIKLKDEFKIEPWTFNQKLGDAVIIPAGCPYQIKNLQSCVNVVLGFVSPENAGECIKLTDKLQAHPTDSKTKASRVEVEKMVISKISQAIDEMRCETKK